MSSRTDGFKLFMESRKSKLLAKSLAITGEIDELKDLCLEDWRKLPLRKKYKFFKKAEVLNEEQRKIDRGIWLEGDRLRGMTLMDNPEMLTEKDYLEMDEERDIVRAIFEDEEWTSQTVVICSFSLYVEPPYDQVFLPAEIGLAAFSVKDGVVSNFARIIEPGEIPQGYKIETICTAEKLGLPKPGKVPEFDDLYRLMMTIDKFLHKHKENLYGGDVAYLFAFDSDYVRISRCFKWLYKETGYSLQLRILSLSYYCYLASTYACKMTATNKDLVDGKPMENLLEINESVIASISPHRIYGQSLIGNFVYSEAHPLTKLGIFLSEDDVEAVIKQVENYTYFEEFCCVYHDKNGKEIQKCALNLANRFAFSILEVLTLSNAVPIKPGAHYPEIGNSAEEKDRRFNMLSRWGITNMEKNMEKRQDEETERCQ